MKDLRGPLMRFKTVFVVSTQHTENPVVISAMLTPHARQEYLKMKGQTHEATDTDMTFQALCMLRLRSIWTTRPNKLEIQDHELLNTAREAKRKPATS